MKKLNKFFAVLVALAMMATMAVTMAFAEDPIPQSSVAPINKQLTVPEGTKVPDGAYATFTFSDPKVNGVAAEDGEAVLSEKKIEFVEANMVQDDNPNPRTYAFQNVTTYRYSYADALDDFNPTRPGVYTWNVVENEYVIDDGDEATTDVKIADDATSYTLVAKVVYDANGNLVVEDVNVKAGKDSQDDESKSVSGLSFQNYYYTTTGNPGEKEDPENPGETIPDEENPGDKEDDAAGLSIEKEVTGTYGDKNTQFELTVNLRFSEIPGAKEASAVIRRANGDIEAVEMKSGDNVIKLASGDRLVFTKIAEGVKYTVKETDSRKGTATEQYTATGEVTTAKAVVKGDNAEKVVNKSNQDSVTPTGILINNLPYIALALVAIGGMVAYIVIRRREEDNA